MDSLCKLNIPLGSCIGDEEAKKQIKKPIALFVLLIRGV